MIGLMYKKAPARLTQIISFIAIAAFLPLLIIAVYRSYQYVSRASGTPANIRVDTDIQLETVDTGFYHAFAQGGEESADMIAPIVAQTKMLSPKIIRLDHIYDHYDVVSRDGGLLSFHWEKLDAAVATIVSTGAKPMLVLSFMPPAIARDGSVINPPNDWNEWALTIQRTVEHYSGRNGKNMSGLYYEVWNEPDLDQFGSWKRSGDKNYLTLYRYAVQGASAAQNVNAFKIGGPCTTGLYESWIRALAESGMRVDFFSWHTYQPNPAQFATDQANLMQWLADYPQHVTKPTLITEFGFTGAKSTMYGTAFGSAHTAAVIRQLISGGPTYLFSFQLKDGPNQESGTGWGLITHESNGLKTKPRYGVYQFMDGMKGTRLQLSGEGSWVTGFAVRNANAYRLMLVNFDANGRNVENVPVTFTGLPPGQYMYGERFLNSRTISTPVTVSGGEFTKHVYMPVFSVAIIELAKTQ